MVRLILILAILFLASCAPTPVLEDLLTEPQVDLVWPSPPQVPRLRMLRSIAEPADIGIRQGAFSRVLQFFTGKERQGMVRPYAVAADDAVIAVADPGLGTVHLFQLNESKYELIRDADGERLVSPVGISLSGNAIFIADSTAGKVLVYDRRGAYRKTISSLVRPTGIAFHAGSRRLFVTDTVENKIVVFDESGTRITEFGERGLAPGQFNYPTTLAINGDTLLVNDTLNYRIQLFSLDGTPLSSFGEIGDGSGQFAMSKGLAADSQGHIYVADALSNYIQIFDEKGRFLLSFGGMGVEAGKFRLPAGLHIFGKLIYIADSQNGRVQVFEYLGGDG